MLHSPVVIACTLAGAETGLVFQVNRRKSRPILSKGCKNSGMEEHSGALGRQETISDAQNI